ncbi:class I SAM-dependent methyltransferase [Halomicrococcus gelatinilyticus]|uniref:class I SAM-dependent methyltransferase n=1 Tax=Halomicrococcus gelatinilyticus TaxID=1702103 RepID=UPI002E118F01
MKKVNLGCGPDYRDGWTNVDINPEFNPDQVIDLEDNNWDLPSSTFDVVLADNVFEHIDPRKRPTFLEECHRILKEDGELVMRWPTPGFGGGWDVTHYSIPSWEWPNHPNNDDYWETEEISFDYSAIGRYLPQSIATQLMCHGIRTIIAVELVASPTGDEYEKTW